MSTQDAISAFRIPLNARVDKRIPKKTLVDNAHLNASEKKLVFDFVEEMQWVAALKPSNIAVPAFNDNTREYIEVAVIQAKLKSENKNLKIAQAIHRAIPYPVVLVCHYGESANVSFAHKRWSQGQSDKIVIEEVYIAKFGNMNDLDSSQVQFFNSLKLSELPAENIFLMYQGMIDRVVALDVAQITGTFEKPAVDGSFVAIQSELEIYEKLRMELNGLRRKATKEKQLNRRVELNLEIKRLENTLDAARRALPTDTSQ